MPNSGNIATISGNLVTNSGIDLSTKADLVNGLIPSTQLPSYVDDVLEFANFAGLPATGETGKIYVTLDNNKIYRWSGSTYIEISASPGSTDSVAEGSTNLYFTNARARAAISLTTTGNSGAATYDNVSGVLNVPNYTLAGLGGQTQLNGTGFVRMSGTTVSYVTGTSSQYVMADGSVSTLTNPITGTAAAGQVAYFTGATTQSGSNNFFWDNTNGRLGIGTASPSYELSVNGTIHSFSSNAVFRAIGGGYGTNYNTTLRSNSSAEGVLQLGNNGANYIIGGNTAAGGFLVFKVNGTTEAVSTGNEVMRLTALNNVLIGGTTDTTEKLQVTGTSKFVGNATFTSSTAENIFTVSSTWSHAYFNLSRADNSSLAYLQFRTGSTNNWQLGTPVGGTYLWLLENGTERFRISNGGAAIFGNTISVTGLGNTNTGRIEFGTSTYKGILDYSATSGLWYFNNQTAAASATTNYYQFQADGTAIMTLTKGGNLGLGTTSPISRLSVAGTGGADGVTLTLMNGGSVLAQNDPLGIIDFYSNDISVGASGSRGSIALRNEFGGHWDGNLIRENTYFSFSTSSSRTVSEKMRIASSGAIRFNSYGTGANAGTVAYNLAVDASGNIIETAGGVVDGSGTANYIPKWQDGNTLANSLLYDNGTNVGIGTTSPGARFTIQTSTISSSDSLRITDGTGVINIGHWDTVTNRFEFSGKPTYFVQYGAGNYMSFGTNGSEYMRIASTGNVGIGDTGPSSKLHVGGDIRVSGAGVAINGYDGGFLDYASSTLRIRGQNTTGGAIAFMTSANGASNVATERMRINSNGDVGIGTANIYDHLFVSKAAGSSIGIGMGGSAGTAASPIYTYLNFRGYGDAIKAQLSSYDVSSNFVGGMLAFSVQNTSAVLTEYMRITSTGNVGIGTISPTEKLVIRGNGAKVRIETETAPTVYYTQMESNYDASNTFNIIDGGINKFGSKALVTYNDTYVNSFYNVYIATGTTTNNNVNNIRLFVTQAGNIGIGTTTPAVKLQVNGTGSSYASQTDILAVFKETGANANAYIAIDNSTNGYDSGIRLATNGVVQWTIVNGKSISPSALWFYDNVSSVARLAITQSGNVGIGNTAPLQLLHVNGNILLDGITNGYTQAATRGIGYGSNNGGVSVDGFSGMDIQSVNAPAPNNQNYSQNLRFWTHHYGTGTGATPRMVIRYDGNIGIGNTNPGVKLDVTGAIRSSVSLTAPEMYGTAYTTLTSGAGTGTAVFDTLTTSGAGAYEVVIIANPNSQGSGSYRDWYIGKLVIGTGYNGAAVVHYIDFIQQSPMPRTLFASGGGDLTVTAMFNNSGTESEEATLNASYTIRFKISGYNTAATGASTAIYLKKIGL